MESHREPRIGRDMLVRFNLHCAVKFEMNATVLLMVAGVQYRYPAQGRAVGGRKSIKQSCRRGWLLPYKSVHMALLSLDLQARTERYLA